MIKKILLLFVMCTLLSTAVFSLEDFVAQAQGSELSFCTFSDQKEDILIVNTGDTFSEYTITVSGSAAPYTTLLPASFTLFPGRSQTLSLFYNVPTQAKGAHDITVTIQTGFGLKKALKRSIVASKCNNNILLAHNFNQTACPCLDMSYDVTIQNAGSAPETYVIGLDKYASVANVSQNPVYLLGGESQDITLSLRLSCDIYGEQLLNVYSSAQGSGIKTKVPLLANIERCYDYDINTGSVVQNTPAKEAVVFAKQESSYSLCAADNSSIHIQLDNTGYIGNNFEYTLEGPSWGALQNSSHSLFGFSSAHTFLNVAPPNDLTGAFTFLLTAQSQLGAERVQKEIAVDVVDCHALVVQSEQEVNVCACSENEIPFTIQNRGSFDESVQLSVSGYNATLSRQTLAVRALNESQASLRINPSCEERGSKQLSIDAELQSGKASDSQDITLNVISKDKCYEVALKPQGSLTISGDASIPLSIAHTGDVQGQYEVEVSGPSWVRLDSASSFNLMPGEEQLIEIIASPAENETQGNYEVMIIVETQGLAYETPLTIKLRGEQSDLSSVLYTYRYWIISVLVLLVLLVLLGFFAKAQFERAKVKSIIKKTKKEQQQKPQKKETSFDLKRMIVLVVVFALIVAGIIFAPRLQSLFPMVGSFFQVYGGYIVAGFVILGLIIFVLKQVEKKE